MYLKSTFYQAQGDYDKSIQFLNKYFSLKDSLTQLEKVQGLLNTEIAFKIEQKEFDKLPTLHKSAFEKGLFKTDKPCYVDKFIPIKKRLKQIQKSRAQQPSA